MSNFVVMPIRYSLIVVGVFILTAAGSAISADGKDEPRLDSQGRQKELARKQVLKKKVVNLYKQAVALYKNNELDKAKDLFAKIIEIDPKHKGAKVYLRKKIPQRIEQLRLAEELKLEELRKKQELAEKEAQRQAAIKAQQEETAKKEALGQKELARQRALKEKISYLYKQAISFYKDKDYSRAETVFNQILSLDSNQAKAKTYLASKIPDKLKELKAKKEARLQEAAGKQAEASEEKSGDVELVGYIAAREYKVREKLRQLQAKQAEKKQRELIVQARSEIDKLFELAREAEKKQDYEWAGDFYEKILKLTADKPIRQVINEQKNRWKKEAMKEENERVRAENRLKAESQAVKTNFTARGRERKSPEEMLEEIIVEKIRQMEEAAKKETAVKAAEEKEEPAKEIVILQEEAVGGAAEQLYLKDFSKSLDEGEQLIAQGTEMFEQKKLKQAYEFFKKAIEVME